MAEEGPIDTLRADELELWDRVLERWNKHTGRQVKIVASTVSVVIVVVGFLGVNSLDTMVEERVRSGVVTAAADVRTDIERDTKRLSDQLGKRLATMIVGVAKLDQEAQKARELVTRMEKDAKRFSKLDTEIRGRMEKTESRIAGFSADFARLESGLTATTEKIQSRMAGFSADFARLETGLTATTEKIQSRMAGFGADFARLESGLTATTEKIQTVKDDLGRVASAALATAPSQEEDSRPASKLPPLSELGPGVLDALVIRQVPTRLGKSGTEYGKQTYLLTFSAFVEETVPIKTARALLDSIEKVTYVLSKRWFRPNIRERTNRNNNFQFTVTVWGRTPVEAKAEFVQGAPPVCWSGLMDLEKTIKLNSTPCK